MYLHLVDKIRDQKHLQGVNYHTDIFSPFSWMAQSIPDIKDFLQPYQQARGIFITHKHLPLRKVHFNQVGFPVNHKQKIINFNFSSISFFYFSVFLNFIKLGFCVRIYNWKNMVTSIIIYFFYDREEE